MIHNTPPSPFSVEYDNQYTRQPTWEDFLQFNHEHAFVSHETPFIQDNGFTTLEGPAPVSEIMFEKPIEAPQPMEMEEEFISYANENTFSPDYEFFSTAGEGEYFPEFNPDENYDELVAKQAQQEAYNGYENSECSRCHSDEEEEEVGSVSTMDSRFADSFLDEANSYTNWESNSVADQTFDVDNDINQKVMNFVLQRPDEEKEYIKRVMPMLLSSIRQIQAQAPIPLNDDLIGSILKELLYKKELMIGEERNFLRGVVDDEMSALRDSRPTLGITEDDLMVQKRKEKRAAKGNRNTSTVNHFNENCVSNVFQFAKRNYPQDKDVQRIGNERNVSATNFKKMMKPTLNDDVFSRKAKARIVANGQELIGNIENWMPAGYFEQCADREKYILNKEKAIRDLGLSGQY
jgi:hypothetical protein